MAKIWRRDIWPHSFSRASDAERAARDKRKYGMQVRIKRERIPISGTVRYYLETLENE